MGPHVDQLPDARRTLTDHQLDDVRVGQAFPRGEGVLDVVFKPVIRPQDRGDAALGLAGGGFRQALLGDQIDPGKLRHLQGVTQPRQPGADYQNIRGVFQIRSFMRSDQLYTT